MIEIKRDGCQVVLHFDLDVPTYETRVFPLSFGCGSGGEVYAGLLARAMQESFGDRVAAARRDAYEQGWKEAKAKRSKAEWFSRLLK